MFDPSFFIGEDGQLFRVIGKEGDKGFHIYCENGHWSCIYDHDMKMAYKYHHGCYHNGIDWSPSTPIRPQIMSLRPCTATGRNLQVSRN